MKIKDILQVKKEILLKKGKENMVKGGQGLSTIDKPLHNTQKESQGFYEIKSYQ